MLCRWLDWFLGCGFQGCDVAIKVGNDARELELSRSVSVSGHTYLSTYTYLSNPPITPTSTLIPNLLLNGHVISYLQV